MGKMLPTGKTSLGRVDMNINQVQAEKTPAILTRPSTRGSYAEPTAALIDQLRDRIRQVETAGRIADDNLITSGCRAIDRLLPTGGYSRGSLVQWITAGGAGADFLSLLVARQACEDGGALVVIDPQHQFFPPAAAALGINLDNLIVLQTGNRVRPPSSLANSVLPDVSSTRASQQDLLWAIDQSLRCPAVAAVWGPLAEIDERWFRRFQLSAESSGCLGLFIQPLAVARQPTWAEIQWLVGVPPRLTDGQASAMCEDLPPPHSHSLPHEGLSTPHPPNHFQQVNLQLTRCRGTHTGKTIELTINHITGDVQLAPRDHEHLRRTNTCETNHSGSHDSARAVSLAAQLAHPATGRQRA